MPEVKGCRATEKIVRKEESSCTCRTLLAGKAPVGREEVRLSMLSNFQRHCSEMTEFVVREAMTAIPQFLPREGSKPQVARVPCRRCRFELRSFLLSAMTRAHSRNPDRGSKES